MNSDLQERLKNLSPAKRAQVLGVLREDTARREQSRRIPKRRQPESAPLSFAQQRLWFIHQLAPDLCAYNFLLAARLKGELNVAALERSFKEIIRRHETLRTTFSFAEREPRQVIAPEQKLSLAVVDLRGEAEERRAATAERLLREQVEQPFDLARGPLLRVKLLRLGEAEYVVVLVLHHIISDGWSMGLLMGEVGRLYEGFVAGREAALEELPIQYGDYAEWQRDWLSGAVLEEQLGYWRKQLAGMTALQLPTDRPRPPTQSFRGASYTFTLSADLSAALRALSKREGVTLFMTLMAALQTLFYRYTGQADMTVSSGTSNRAHADTEALIGCFINILLFRSDLSGNPCFSELLGRLRKVAMDAYEHQDLPFELLVEALHPERDLSYNPLAQVMFVLHNAPSEAIQLKDLVIEPFGAERNAAQLDLNLQIWERADGLTGLLEYDTDLFERPTIVRMMDHFRILLKGIVLHPSQRLSELPLLSKAEQDQLLVQLNNTQSFFPEHLCLHQLFEAQVESAPQAIAAVAENDTLTYQELNRRANQLAYLLRWLGVRPGAPAAICVERSLEMVIGLVGILKAGAAIVPLDPSYPKDRLAFMLKDAQVPVLLTQSRLTPRLPEYEGHLIDLESDARPAAENFENNGNSGVTPGDLAYVIYTSGSTGQPKAVMLNHRGRVNNFFDFNQRFGIDAGDRLIALSSLSFDMTAYDVFGTLASGGTIVFPQAAKERDPAHWADLMRRHNVTIWHSAPALLEMLVEHIEGRPDAVPCSLRLALLGGDWIPLSLPERLKKQVAGVSVIGLGGATEASMDSIIYPIERNDPAWRSIPYGRPMANQTSYILDSHLQPVPVGVPGELHLGGIGVAWWYHNRPALSAEKFIPNPFSAELGARLYKTGDLARHMPDGNIELLGRIDNQVKLRGLRIELGEIVSALRQHPGIKDAVALIREDHPENKYLTAYFVAQNEPPPASSELRSLLKKTLPDYMVPSFFISLPALPLTPNGKVDRRSLPAPDTTKRESAFVPPRTPVEEVVAAVWATVLPQKQVGIHDGFFDLGGHSLMATQVISRLQSSFSIELPLRHIFESPTVSGLAQTIEAIGSANRVDVSGIARILIKLDRMSDSEVEGMLREKSGQTPKSGKNL